MTNDKLVIPEKIAIRLMNSSELTAEQFYKHILEKYRILNQMQQQRQQFLQNQHLQLQQLANGNKFQEIFATATIIQSNPNDPLKKAVTPTNGTFLLEPVRPNQQLDPAHIPILGTSTSHIKRKFHRKHYGHHRRQNSGKHKPVPAEVEPEQEQPGEVYAEIPLNPPTPVIQESYTSMPIPLILNSKEDKTPYTHHSHTHAARRTTARKRTTPMTVSGYDTESTYRNPLLAGEFIFEK